MKNCPKCGRPVVNAFFCPSCGQALDETAELQPELRVAAAIAQPSIAQPTAGDSAPAPPSPVVSTTRSKASKFSLLLIAVAIAGIGSLMLLASSTRSAGTPPVNGASAESRVETARAPAPVAASKSISVPSKRGSAPRWNASGPSRRGFNGITFELAADDDVDVWRKRVRPVLTVRCTAKETEVFVWTQSAASIEPTGHHTVQVTFDGGGTAAETWEHSVDHEALFAPDGRALMRQIASARGMSFAFTPFNASPAVVHFSVAGFDAQSKSAAKTCGWKR